MVARRCHVGVGAIATLCALLPLHAIARLARPCHLVGVIGLLCALLPLLVGAQWDSEGRAQVVGLSDLQAMKGLRLLGRELAPLASAQEAAGVSAVPHVSHEWCNATSYGRGRDRIHLCVAYTPTLSGQCNQVISV